MTFSASALTAPSPLVVDYGHEIEAAIAHLSSAIARSPDLTRVYRPRWLAIQLLEGDESLLAEVRAVTAGAAIIQELDNSSEQLRRHYGDDVDVALADKRYGFVNSLVRGTLTRPSEQPRTLSDRIDQIVTNRYLGIPIFLVLMYLVFNMVQNVAAPYLDWVDYVISGPITNWVIALLGLLSAPEWLTSLAVDGGIAGVSGVLVFVPGLIVLYTALAILEDSGYMARAAFVMDRLMSLLGLHGKSFLPMIVGFGCNVPAIYATRTIENRKARLVTGLMVPFMSCSARLPVYVVFALAFFPNQASWVIWGLYVFGIIVAAFVGAALSRVVLKGQPSAFVMELPPYRLPTLRGVFTHVHEHIAHFVRKAGTVILTVSMLIWVLLNIPLGVQDSRDSLYGQVSATIAPVFAPAGFGSWESSGALITGFVAKEVVVSTMAVIYLGDEEATEATPTTFGEDLAGIVTGFGTATVDAGKQLISVLTPGLNLFPAEEEATDNALATALQSAFTPLSALAFMVFVLLYVPCVATLAAQRQEYGWTWAGVAIAIQTILPWIIAVLIYQGGRLLGFQ